MYKRQVGQLVRYYISLNKSKDKYHSLSNPFINATSDDVIKSKLKQFYKKYNYAIKVNNNRYNNLYQMIISYIPSGKVISDDIIAGYISNNLISVSYTHLQMIVGGMQSTFGRKPQIKGVPDVYKRQVYRIAKPDFGTIYLDGKPLDNISIRKSAQNMAVVAQFNNLNFDCSVLDVVMLGRTPHLKMMEQEKKEDYEIAYNALKSVGMYEKRNRSYLSLSGGEKQRVVLARAITCLLYTSRCV